MNVYFVRHGHTKCNEENKYYGSYESELTSVGINQGEVIRDKLAYINFDKIYCSPRNRAISTLKIMISDLDEVVFEPLISERDFGIFENKTYKDISENHKEECKLWELDWIDYRIPMGESHMDTYIRLEEFMNKLEKDNCENILVVTHGGLIRNMYCYILGGIEFFWKFSSCNGDITVVKYEYGNWFIDSINHI